MKLLRDIGYIVFGKYGQYIVTLVTLPLLARALGPEKLGYVAVAMAGYFLGAVATEMGLTQFLAAYIKDSLEFPKVRFAYMLLRLSILTTISLTFSIVTVFGAPYQVQIFTLGLLYGGLSVMGEDWVLLGSGRFGTYVLIQMASRAAYLVALLVLLYDTASPLDALNSLAISSIFTVVLTWLVVNRDHGKTKSHGQWISTILRTASTVLPARLLTTAYGLSGTAAFAIFLPASAIGLYSASDRLIRAGQSALDAIGIALLPRLLNEQAGSRFWSGVQKGCYLAGGMGVLCSGLVWLGGDIAVDLIYGNQFVETAELLKVQSLLLVAVAVNSFINTAVYPTLNDGAGLLVGAAIGAACIVSAIVVAANTKSVWSLVIGVVASEYVVLVWNILRLLRHKPQVSSARHRASKSVPKFRITILDSATALKHRKKVTK